MWAAFGPVVSAFYRLHVSICVRCRDTHTSYQEPLSVFRKGERRREKKREREREREREKKDLVSFLQPAVVFLPFVLDCCREDEIPAQQNNQRQPSGHDQDRYAQQRSLELQSSYPAQQYLPRQPPHQPLYQPPQHIHAPGPTPIGPDIYQRALS